TTISARQAATEALGNQADWCHHFRALGHRLNDDPNYAKRLQNWLAEPPLVLGRLWLQLALWVQLPWFALVVFLLFSLPVWQMALPLLLPTALLLRHYGQEISRRHSQTASVADALQHYATLFEPLETAPWLEPELQAIQAPLLGPGRPSLAIRRLAYAAGQLDVRNNAFALLLEFAGLWSLQWLYQLDRWRQQYRNLLPAWLAALAEIDALVSLANLRFNHPNWCQPQISTEPLLKGVALGHPLIPAHRCVLNDLNIETDGHLHLITGSNMAGKSTWLRTVGTNLVLAQAGAPACAAALAPATPPTLDEYAHPRQTPRQQQQLFRRTQTIAFHHRSHPSP
ncbi:MAG: hypothetical protein HC821_03895, partial [Lewinella sp.]|nr:hypothetical protein [Lewinella sp.]